MGSVPDPIFDQVSATTVAEFPKSGGRKSKVKAPKPHRSLKSLIGKGKPKGGRKKF